jgi:NADH dehydrogenase
MIVVAGGSGRLGTLLVRRLVERPLPVRVLTRDPARASHLARLPIDIARADVRDATGLARAVAGADTIVSAVHGFAGPGGVSPESVDRDGNAHLVDAARAAGASLVLTSIVGAAPDNALELFRAKYDAEQYLRRSGVPWTIVRATAFVETWATIVGDPRRRKLMVLGRGDNPINFVSAADVAALLELVVVDAAFRGRIVEIGGPDKTNWPPRFRTPQAADVRWAMCRVRRCARWAR